MPFISANERYWADYWGLPYVPVTVCLSYLYKATVETWGAREWPNMKILVMRESGCKSYAVNMSNHRAGGAPQALPVGKMGELRHTIQGQIEWMVDYILARYETPTKAKQHHDSRNWY